MSDDLHIHITSIFTFADGNGLRFTFDGNAKHEEPHNLDNAKFVMHAVAPSAFDVPGLGAANKTAVANTDFLQTALAGPKKGLHMLVDTTTNGRVLCLCTERYVQNSAAGCIYSRNNRPTRRTEDPEVLQQLRIHLFPHFCSFRIGANGYMRIPPS